MNFTLLDPKIRRHFGHYAWQVSLATVSLAGVLWAEQLLTGAAVARAILVAAVASTAFVLFISPHSDTARPRHVLGGHLIALVIGGGLGMVADSSLGRAWLADFPALFAVYAAAAVGATMFVMAGTNAEHPPAAGTALGVVTHSFSWELVAFVAFETTPVEDLGGFRAILVGVLLHPPRGRILSPEKADHDGGVVAQRLVPGLSSDGGRDKKHTAKLVVELEAFELGG